jgi:hypothetical protein
MYNTNLLLVSCVEYKITSNSHMNSVLKGGTVLTSLGKDMAGNSSTAYTRARLHMIAM